MAMPIVTMSLPANLFLIALVTKVYPLSSPMIGLLSAMPFVGNILQIAAVPILSRWRPPKTITVTASALHLATWAALGFLLRWIPRNDPAAAGRWLVAWFLVSSFLGAIAGVTWNSWIQEWVPARIRGKYFGRRNSLRQISTLAFLLSAGWVLARWNYSLAAFEGIIAAAILMRLFSLRWQWISPTKAHGPPSGQKPAFPAQVGVLRASRSFLIFVAFGAVWSFAANCFGPFYSVFMFEPIGMSAWNVGVTATLAQLGGVFSLPAWGLLLDRYGNKSVMVFSLLLWQLQYLAWCFVTPETRDLLYILWAWAGATSAGFILGQFTLLLKLIPEGAKDLALGFNLAVTSFFTAVAPIAGGWILEWASGRWRNPLAVYHCCFLVQPAMTVLGAFLLLRVNEPAASPISAVVGAMRNIRMLGSVLGLSVFFNYPFFRATRRR